MSVSFWKKCKQSLENQLTQSDFTRWIKPLAFEEENLILAPNKYFIDVIKHNGIWDKLNGAFLALAAQQLKIKVAPNSHSTYQSQLESNPTCPIASEPVLSSVATQPNHAMLDFGVDQSESKHYARNKCVRFDLTFDKMIETQSNQLAVTVARSIAQGGCIYNPMLIYSNPGLGKTHLLHAIKNEIENINPMRQVLYLQAVDFLRDVVSAIRARQIEKLKADYQSYNVLLIDDVQFFSNKQSTLEEFFQLLNFFLDQNRQVVLTSDELPNNITFPDRIRSRLVSGLPVEISMPNFEDRVLLLNQFSKQKKLSLDTEVIYWITTRAKMSVRDLKSLLNPLQASLSTGLCADTSLAEVQRILAPVLCHHSVTITPESIIDEVARFYSLRPTDLRGKLRRKNIVHARHMAMNLIKENIDYSLLQIAQEFNRDHSTVLHALTKISALRKANNLVNQDYLRLSSRITQPNQ